MTKKHAKLDRRHFLATSGLLGGSMLAGCSGGSNNQANPNGSKTGKNGQSQNVQGGGTFVGTTAEDATTLDPRMNELAWVNGFLHYIFDSLYLPNPDGTKFVPHLAKKLPQEQDKSTYVVPLRKGVKFHNGTEMTAEDVAYSINWILDPKNKSPNKANLDFIDTVEASGKYETTFNLKYPFALFKQVLSGMNAAIVPKSVAKKKGQKKFGQNPVGSGPFKFQKSVSSSHIDLTRNKDYFLKKPNLQNLKMRIIPKPQVQFVELASGGVHQATVPKNLLGKARSQKNIQMKTISQFDYNGLIFNSMRKPFDDVKVRKAMQYLVDYDKMIKSSKGPLGKRAYGFMPKAVNKSWDFPWKEWKNKYYPPKNHSKAKKLLKEAGYGGGVDKTLKISSLASSKFKNLAIILQNELEKVGIKANVKEVTIGQWLTELDQGKFDVNIYGWSGGQDPDGFFYYLFRDMRNDDGGLSQDVVGNASAAYLYQSKDSNKLKQVDQKIRKARKVTNKKKRKQMYIEAAETWQSLYPHIPVFSEQAATAWSTAVKNYEPNAFTQQPLCSKWSNAYIQK